MHSHTNDSWQFGKLLKGTNDPESNRYQMLSHFSSEGKEIVKISGIDDLEEGQEFCITIELIPDSNGKERK